MARIVRREKRQRGIVGWIFLVLFWAFNAWMLTWLIQAMQIVGNAPSTSSAEQIGRTIGGAISFWFIVSVWGSGDIVLGLFVLLTRGSKVIVDETRDDRWGERQMRTIESRPKRLIASQNNRYQPVLDRRQEPETEEPDDLPFVDLRNEISGMSKRILAEAKRDGFDIAFRRDRATATRGDMEMVLQSNYAIERFGRRQGYQI